MKHSLFFTGIAAMLLTSSCDKPKMLIKERVLVEAEILRSNEELRNVDAKFEALRTAPISYGKTLEHHREEIAKKNADLETDMAFLDKKCTEMEAVVAELRPRLEAYKAKHLR